MTARSALTGARGALLLALVVLLAHARALRAVALGAAAVVCGVGAARRSGTRYTVQHITAPGCAEELAAYSDADGDDYKAQAHACARQESIRGRTTEVWRDAGSGPSLEARGTAADWRCWRDAGHGRG